jgi:hypothetical protein
LKYKDKKSAALHQLLRLFYIQFSHTFAAAAAAAAARSTLDRYSGTKNPITFYLLSKHDQETAAAEQ